MPTLPLNNSASADQGTTMRPAKAALRFEKYRPEHYPILAEAARKVGVDSLLHREFVDYYYSGQPWSELFLALEDDGRCAAFIGFDRLRFENQGSELNLGMATNFYTLQPGIGGFLWLQWMKTCKAGLVFGGSEHTHRIVKSQKFTYYPGVNIYTMNARYSVYNSDPAWRKAVKRGLQLFVRKPLRDYQTKAFLEESVWITVREISSSDAAPMANSEFAFRFAPSTEYLRWRYNSSLGFVRYRWFNVYVQNERIGYCVLNDAPGQIVVAHTDGANPKQLALGVLKSLFTAAKLDDSKTRTALLSSSHPQMQDVYTRYGFHLDASDRPVAIGSMRSQIHLPEPQQWLFDFGLGDNDLRPHLFHG